MRYLGRRVGYYPQDPNEAYDVDWAIDTLNDIQKDNFYEPWQDDRSPTKTDVAERVQQITKLNKQIEKKLDDGRKWLAGKKLTIADFTIAACYHSVVLNDHVKHDSLKKAMYDTLKEFP